MEAKNLKCLVKTAGVLSEENRRKLLDDVYRLIQNWRGPLPTHEDLVRTCPAKQIEFLLSQVVIDKHGDIEARKRFIEFVIATGYKDEPGVAPNGQYQLVRRTTPIHLALRVKIYDWDGMVRLLFRIYDRLDLNYVDEDGLTHFHAAFGLADNRRLVRIYLMNGQDPNIKIRGCSLLRYAVWFCDTVLATDLLTNKADPTQVDDDGCTALHMICESRQEILVKIFYRESGPEWRNFQVNVYDRLGETPLHLAAKHCSPETIDKLLRLGADPNLADSDGCTALHLICKRDKPYRSLTKFFETCDALRLQVNINAKNNEGRTPLNLLYYMNRNKHNMTTKLMENRGAQL
ncbi:hypothetical protein TKK_0013110 [Trichogramma kaykai]|uniref:Uncharacterized protein n=1 Tax=Trichogramma kaykai TaxID=54128 RepID=A0ABD2WJK3_9HYME